MNRILETFGVPRVLLPVIHPVTREAALHSIGIASDAGCRGVWLIDQGMSAEDVLRLVLTVRDLWPALWVGVNLLRHHPSKALRRALADCDGRIDGIWSDDAGIDEKHGIQHHAEYFVRERQTHHWQGLYFGGVAFKCQSPVDDEDLPGAAAAALPMMDVVCTSGPGTGQPASVAKVVAMREGLGPTGALALASGVDEENVADYLPHVDAFLVGTGIERTLGALDAGKAARLQAAIAAYGEALSASS
jgi:predicted TIM-barrel enzyme